MGEKSLKWTRVDNYWGFDEKFPQNRLPYVDEINALIMKEPATRLAGFALREGGRVLDCRRLSNEKHR